MATVADVAGAPGGGSLAFTARCLQISMARRDMGWRPPGGRYLSKLTRGRRCKRLNGERVDIAFQHVIHGCVNQPVARDGGNAAKGLSHDAHPIVALPAGGARMSGVQMAFVFDHQLNRCEPGNQLFAQALLSASVLTHK